jgi:hypothetical protein
MVQAFDKLEQAVLLFYLVGRILAFRKLLDEISLGMLISQYISW